jgi:ABC-type dipeptide/oligopeptide/nickel transport system ATPase subunit
MHGVSLTSFSLRNYRNIASADLDFSGGVLGIIGVNASGKTNLARAGDFLFRHLMGQVFFRPGGARGSTTKCCDLTWSSMKEVSPGSVLSAGPKPGPAQFEIRFVVNPSLLKELGDGFLPLGRDERHTLTVACELAPQSDSGGQLLLVPSFTIKIETTDLIWGQAANLRDLLTKFNLMRIAAHEAPATFLETLKQLSDANVAGHRAFEAINKEVCATCCDFAPISFIAGKPTAMEAEIPDLAPENMSSGNLKALHLLGSMRQSPTGEPAWIHLEEPESHLNPSLQREIVRRILENRPENVVLTIESHSPHVLAELLASNVPIYRVEVMERQPTSRVRKSQVTLLPQEKASELIQALGAESAFATLGGILIITDGVTDPPVYRQFFSLFVDLRQLLYCFLPMPALESRRLELKEVARIAPKVLLIADGHLAHQRPKLEQECKEAGIRCVSLSRWGVENFFPLEALKKAADSYGRFKVDDETTLDPNKPLGTRTGIDNYSKNHHNEFVAPFVEKAYLESQEDFMAIVKALRELAASR